MKPFGCIVPNKIGISKYFEHRAPSNIRCRPTLNHTQAQQTPNEQKDLSWSTGLDLRWLSTFIKTPQTIKKPQKTLPPQMMGKEMKHKGSSDHPLSCVHITDFARVKCLGGDRAVSVPWHCPWATGSHKGPARQGSTGRERAHSPGSRGAPYQTPFMLKQPKTHKWRD